MTHELEKKTAVLSENKNKLNEEKKKNFSKFSCSIRVKFDINIRNDIMERD